MQVSDILNRKGSGIISISPQASVQDAVTLLMKHRFGSLLVMEGEEIRGIITERDVLRECAHNAARLAERKIADAMSSPVITASPDDTIKAVQRLMIDQRVRHVPIVEGGRVMGMVAIGDVLRILLDATESEAQDLRDFLVEKNVVG